MDVYQDIVQDVLQSMFEHEVGVSQSIVLCYVIVGCFLVLGVFEGCYLVLIYLGNQLTIMSTMVVQPKHRGTSCCTGT